MRTNIDVRCNAQMSVGKFGTCLHATQRRNAPCHLRPYTHSRHWSTYLHSGTYHRAKAPSLCPSDVNSNRHGQHHLHRSNGKQCRRRSPCSGMRIPLHPSRPLGATLLAPGNRHTLGGILLLCSWVLLLCKSFRDVPGNRDIPALGHTLGGIGCVPRIAARKASPQQVHRVASPQCKLCH